MIYVSRKFHRGARGTTAKSPKKETKRQGLRTERLEITENNQGKKAIKKPLIAIVGPTSSGKTDLAIYLAKKLNGELISADSRQIYRGLDIGTGKEPSYPHHLIDIIDPGQPFSVKDYLDRVLAIIEVIHQNGRVPILVGGTGYYIDAVLFKHRIPAVPPSGIMRSHLHKLSNDRLYKLLSQKDKKSASRIARTNRRRLIRALEIIFSTGKPILPRLTPYPRFNDHLLALKLERIQLYRRIDRRVIWMMSHGLIEETQWLLSKISPNHELAKTIGYHEVVQYLGGALSKEKLLSKIQSHTHALARKQISWWKRYQDIHWVTSKRQALLTCLDFLKNQGYIFKSDS